MECFDLEVGSRCWISHSYLKFTRSYIDDTGQSFLSILVIMSSIIPVHNKLCLYDYQRVDSYYFLADGLTKFLGVIDRDR
jgi:hypothetical protein